MCFKRKKQIPIKTEFSFIIGYKGKEFQATQDILITKYKKKEGIIYVEEIELGATGHISLNDIAKQK